MEPMSTDHTHESGTRQIGREDSRGRPGTLLLPCGPDRAWHDRRDLDQRRQHPTRPWM